MRAVNNNTSCGQEIVLKNRNQSVRKIEMDRSHGVDASPRLLIPKRNSLAKLNRKELRSLVDNPQTAKLKARNELDKIMQVDVVVICHHKV